MISLGGLSFLKFVFPSSSIHNKPYSVIMLLKEIPCFVGDISDGCPPRMVEFFFTCACAKCV